MEFHPAPRTEKGRGAADLDRSDEVPDGCTLRRYFPETRSGYWKATMPKGVRHAVTKKNTRSLAWGFYSQRTENEAREMVRDWAWEGMS